MSSFQSRVSGDDVYREQLRQLAKHHKTSLTKLIRDAIDAKYGKELSKFHTSAIFVVSGGSSVNHSTTNEPSLEQAS